MFNLRCVPFEKAPGYEEVGKRLPKNPLLNALLNCPHTHELNATGEYHCKCLEGWTYSQFSGSCVLMKRCKRCGPNQRCQVDAQGNQQCVCNDGFFGVDCQYNWCEAKKANLTKNELVYIEESTRNVCGTSQCELNKSHGQFECKCPSRMEPDGRGLCKVRSPCAPNGVGFKQCSEDDQQFCSVRIDESPNYQCRCAQETGYNLQRTCNKYKSKFVRPTNITHTLSMRIRLDWEADRTFFSLFSNQIYHLLSTGLDRKFPGFAIPHFIDYEQEVFKSYQNVAFYRPILEDKLRTIFLNGLNEFEHLREQCGRYNVYPQFNYNALNLTRLIETEFVVDYLINCEGPLNIDQTLDKFANEFLLQDYLEGYLYLNHTGYVVPGSVEIY